MNALTQEVRVVHRTPEELKRLQTIREGLVRGDKKKIADQCQVNRLWVYQVLNGVGTSERILQAAERLIRERESQTN